MLILFFPFFPRWPFFLWTFILSDFLESFGGLICMNFGLSLFLFLHLAPSFFLSFTQTCTHTHTLHSLSLLPPHFTPSLPFPALFLYGRTQSAHSWARLPGERAPARAWPGALTREGYENELVTVNTDVADKQPHSVFHSSFYTFRAR